MLMVLSVGKVSEYVMIGISFYLIGWYMFCGLIIVFYLKLFF